jgi:hypothetical protein
MLNCILGMVDKTKRALSILQQRNIPASLSPTSSYKTAQANYNNGMPLSTNIPPISNASHTHSSDGNVGRSGVSNFASIVEGMVGGVGQGGAQYVTEGASDTFIRSKIPVSDMLAATLRSTEERVVEVRRRAEEAVLEVTLYNNI